jgi:hypothetical protein
MNINTRALTPSAAEQTRNNTTSWIGHLPGDNNQIVRGQTFISDAEGDLQSIEVYSNMVADPGKVVMTLHSFDPGQQSWGPVLATTSVNVNPSDAESWISFNMPGPHLNKGKTYGFRMETNETLIGVGEAAGSSNQPPLSSGQEWKFTGNDRHGDAYSYFSLAFRVGIRA